MGIAELIQTLGNTGLAWILLAAGLYLIGVAVKDLVANLSGKEKKWGGALSGILVGVIGGLMLVFSAAGIVSFFKAKGNDIPHQ